MSRVPQNGIYAVKRRIIMSKLTKEEILKRAKSEDIKFVRLQFCDIFGQSKSVTITVSQLAKALDNKCMFDGSSIEGFVRIEESDMYLYPDYDTYVVFPFSDDAEKTARLICDIYKPSGEPFEGDPRYVLRRVLKKASDMGYSVNIGPECEFFLFENDENGMPTLKTKDKDGYFDMSPLGVGGTCRRDICLALEQMGFNIETSHHECAPAQHEIDFKYADALTAADNIITFKNVVKSIAKRHNLYATFMPKPVFGVSGSGMHINISLFDNKEQRNAFCCDTDKYKLSPLAYSFIAGVMDKICEITPVTNPLVNSYKRLVPDYEAPVYVAWSGKNRSPLIRVPACGGSSTRIELRSPDPSCNAYLALAVVIAAGLYGIEKGLKPLPGVDKNIFDLTKEERKALSIRSLPLTLERAVEDMEASDFAKEVLGDHIYTKYLAAKKTEWKNYTSRVTPWEIDSYFGSY